MGKDLDFDQLYPNRFIKSGEFNGKDVTLTIAGVSQEELEGSTGKKVKVVIAFRETKKEWVAPKTCGICLKLMFGRRTSGWVGRKVTLYPADVMAFGEMVQAIRVRGSPELPNAIETQEQLGRAKVTFKLVPTGKKAANGNGKPAARPTAPAEDADLPPDAEPPESDPNEPPLFGDDAQP